MAEIKETLKLVLTGKISVDEAAERLRGPDLDAALTAPEFVANMAEAEEEIGAGVAGTSIDEAFEAIR